MKSQKYRDLNVALNLHEELNVLGVTENAIIPGEKNKEKYKPRTLVDQTLELIDPTPNIHTLFVQFNAHFFWNVLLPVEVKWSNRMTSCAGICYYHPQNKQCVITLSLPLLKLRPRKDLVETLLHEMIHGYLFITNNNRDRDGHGPEFCKHMHRINKEAGTNITIYHNFHDEVKLYQQHWWRCDGPCQRKAPYFGTVRRAVNRAPGPSDFWWKEHKQNCGGQFIKIKEPENFKKQNVKSNQKSKTVSKDAFKESDISKWLTKSNNPSEHHKFNNTPTSKIKPASVQFNTEHDKINDNDKVNHASLNKNIKKLGNNTNNVHGWGIGGPSNSSSTSKVINTQSKQPKYSWSGQLGGSRTGQSNLIDKFSVKINKQTLFAKPLPSDKINADKNKLPNFVKGKTNINQIDTLNKEATKCINCPICNVIINVNTINEHIDLCLNEEHERKSDNAKKSSIYNVEVTNTSLQQNYGDLIDIPPLKLGDCTSTPKRNSTHTSSNKRLKTENLDKSKLIDCPVCYKSFEVENIHDHLDTCLPEQNPSSSLNNSDNVITINSSSDSDLPGSTLINSFEIATSTSSNHRKNDIVHKAHKCLVCDMIITPTMSLNEHLEECIGTVFNDESTSFSEYEDDNSEETHVPGQKYACPVCMELFAENNMNQHLDTCLKKK